MPEQNPLISLASRCYQEGKRFREKDTEVMNPFTGESITNPWYYYDRLYRGFQWDFVSSMATWASRPFKNVIFQGVETYTTLLTDSRPSFSVVPREESDEELADVVKAAVEYWWDKENMDAKTALAVKASRILDIALTSRNKSSDGADVPLCGIPYHSCTPYIARLIEAGEKVAICEQVEDPKSAKGIVRREVVKVVTPGLVIDTESLAPKENNYLLSLCGNDKGWWGLAYLDLSTGEFRITELADLQAGLAEITCISPREIILPACFREEVKAKGIRHLVVDRTITYFEEWIYDADYCKRLIVN